MIKWIKIYWHIWCWLLSQFAVDVTVNNAYQIYRQSHLNPGEYRSDALGFCRAIVDVYYHLYRKRMPFATLFTGIRILHHPANNLQFDGLPRTDSDGVAYQDLKEPRYIIEKNAMSIFMLNVSSYVSKSRTVCVFKIEKRKLHTKK